MYFQRLRDLREDKDLRQEDVAEILGISQTVYSRYERGFQTIPVVHLLKLADFYQVSTDYILGRTNAANPIPSSNSVKMRGGKSVNDASPMPFCG